MKVAQNAGELYIHNVLILIVIVLILIVLFPDTAYRIPEESAATLPKIPSQPISYGDAQHFLRSVL